MILLNEYVGCWELNPDWTAECQKQALLLLSAVNALMVDYGNAGFTIAVNPKTNSQVSGETGGGFRPQNYPVGAPNSAHKMGMGVDIYDHDGKLDKWIDTFPQILIKHNLYREDPNSTEGWSHLQTRETKSGHRTFLP